MMFGVFPDSGSGRYLKHAHRLFLINHFNISHIYFTPRVTSIPFKKSVRINPPLFPGCTRLLFIEYAR